jgi:hypothetical protein
LTAVVHGQTQGSGQQPASPAAQPAAACPAASSGSAFEKASADIRALQQAASASGGTGDPAASGRLAEAYLRRAGLRREAGRLHHALFDAEEAIRLQPNLPGAAGLVASLQAALLLPQAATAAAQGEEDGQLARDEGLDAEPF